MPRLRLSLFGMTVMLLTAPALQAATVQLQLTGLSGELQNNVRIRLAAIASEEVTADNRFQARLTDSIKQSLQALGYFQPVITFPTPPESLDRKNPIIRVKVDAGPPVKIAGSTIVVGGEGSKDPDYQQWIAAGRPVVGTVLNQGKYDSFKSGFSGIALRNGYFDGEFKKSQLGVSVERHEAFWDIDYDSGQRYRFGDVSFTGSQIREEYLRQLVPYHKGDYYSSRDLAELNRRLSATGWFSSVVASPEFGKSRQDKVLPVSAVLTPAVKNTAEAGIGYSTDVGPHVKASWKRPWVNDYGHSMSVSTYLSQPEQQLDMTYKIPLLKSPLEQYYLLQGGVKRTDLNDTRSDTSTLAVSRYWDNQSGWQKAVNLRWSLDNYTQGNISDNTMLIYPGVSVNRTRSRGGLMPTWGDSQRYSVDVSDTGWGSDVDFVIMQAQNVWIRTLAEKNRFVFRGNLGWIETSNFNRIPPDLRFFAGGDRSIRGYKYKDISPRDSDGKLTGASKMATGSAEYQYNFTGKWWGAVFIDSGEAVNNIKDSDFKTGAGVGIRWASPVGPIKLDIARPVGDSGEHGLQFYIGLGPEL
ncbi:outer membrane protein assembly factor [Tatumella sp. JGM16]|nr:outer membrane protein assembly factor [Tatumella sp. JGM16]MBS0892912.1 outer membrane protein assembly factor [Tatumella sp. JGM130]MBS0911746.1 outer membrane protein assembly factor [Tatumella sp. JGM91]